MDHLDDQPYRNLDEIESLSRWIGRPAASFIYEHSDPKRSIRGSHPGIS
jgi:hypothetical protein